MADRGTGNVIDIVIRGNNGQESSVIVNLNWLVSALRDWGELLLGYENRKLYLVHRGWIMREDRTLRCYGVQRDDIVYFNDVGDLAPTSLSEVPIEGMQRYCRYPKLIGDILNVPGVEELENNPEVVRHVIMNNPQMHALMDQSPKLAHILDQPAIVARRRLKNLGALVGNPIDDEAMAKSSYRLFCGLYRDLLPDSKSDHTIAHETELMQDPTISQTMQNMLSDSEYMNQMIGFNQELQDMLNSRPWIRDAMQSPTFISLLATPQIVREHVINYRDLVSHAAQEEGRNSAERGFVTAAWRLERLMNLFGHVATCAGIATPAAPASRPQGTPEE